MSYLVGLGDHELSLEAFERAYVASSQDTSSTFVLIAFVAARVGSCYLESSQYTKALPYLEESARVFERLTKRESEYCVWVQSHIALCLYNTNRE